MTIHYNIGVKEILVLCTIIVQKHILIRPFVASADSAIYRDS